MMSGECQALLLKLQQELNKFLRMTSSVSALDAQAALGAIFELLEEYYRRSACVVTTSPEFVYTCEVFRWIHDDLSKGQVRLARLSYYVAIIGNLNTGKSCTINALIGWDLSPWRHTAMTMIPCRFMNEPSRRIPFMTFKLADFFQSVLERLRVRYHQCLAEANDDSNAGYDMKASLSSLERDQPGVLARIKDPATVIAASVEGEDAVSALLCLINDMVRLVHIEPFHDMEIAKQMLELLSESVDNFPVVHVAFRNEELISGDDVGCITIIDTPGPNETDARQGPSSNAQISAFLRQIHGRVLRQVDSVILVRCYHVLSC
jgi:hypothetical protein